MRPDRALLPGDGRPRGRRLPHRVEWRLRRDMARLFARRHRWCGRA